MDDAINAFNQSKAFTDRANANYIQETLEDIEAKISRPSWQQFSQYLSDTVEQVASNYAQTAKTSSPRKTDGRAAQAKWSVTSPMSQRFHRYHRLR